MVDPDLQIRGGGGGRHPDSEIRGGPGLKKNFLALWASFWSKNKGGGQGPRALPLDQPLPLRESGIINNYSTRARWI